MTEGRPRTPRTHGRTLAAITVPGLRKALSADGRSRPAARGADRRTPDSRPEPSPRMTCPHPADQDGHGRVPAGWAGAPTPAHLRPDQPNCTDLFARPIQKPSMTLWPL